MIHVKPQQHQQHSLRRAVSALRGPWRLGSSGSAPASDATGMVAGDLFPNHLGGKTMSQYHIISFHYSWFVNVCYIPKRHVRTRIATTIHHLRIFWFCYIPKNHHLMVILWSFCGHLMVILWLVMARYSLNHRSGRPFNCVALPKRRLWGYSSPWPPNIKAQTSVTGVSDADVVLRCIGLIGWKTWNKRTG